MIVLKIPVSKPNRDSVETDKKSSFPNSLNPLCVWIAYTSWKLFKMKSERIRKREKKDKNIKMFSLSMSLKKLEANSIDANIKRT